MSVKVILMYIFLISGKTISTLICTYMKVSGFIHLAPVQRMSGSKESGT